MEQTEYAITELVTVRPGEPFRLLPFGRLVKGGRSWDITPEFARRFQLPHFKPPIKMGSHSDETPAVLRAYGWPEALSDEEILERLLGLNLERAGK